MQTDPKPMKSSGMKQTREFFTRIPPGWSPQRKQMSELIAFRPNDEDKERIVRTGKTISRSERKQPRWSVLFRRGLENWKKVGASEMSVKLRKLRGSWYIVLIKKAKPRKRKIGGTLEYAREVARQIQEKLTRGDLGVTELLHGALRHLQNPWMPPGGHEQATPRGLDHPQRKRLAPGFSVRQNERCRWSCFPIEAGTPIFPDNIGPRYMEPALEQAGLRKFRFHDLRHTFGSLLIQAGVSPAYVQNQMGHRSIQITIDVYGYLIPGENVAWIDTLDSTPQEVAATDVNRIKDLS
jgi:hypothetical protein